MNERKKNYIFYCKEFRYEGTIISETDTHFIIFDTKKNKTFHLPKSETSMEEVK